jgi:hypothetical protein
VIKHAVNKVSNHIQEEGSVWQEWKPLK